MIALFVFTILSALLMTALHNMITIISGAERSAEMLHQLQITFLMMQRDIEQTVAITGNNAQPANFTGAPTHFTFVHAGFAGSVIAQDVLTRTKYSFQSPCLLRQSDAVFNIGNDGHARCLLSDVKRATFVYYDQANRKHTAWPLSNNHAETLPKAIGVTLHIAKQGSITEIFLINAQLNNNHAISTPTTA